MPAWAKRAGAAALAAALLLGASGCDCNTPDTDLPGELLGEWYLSSDADLAPRLEHLADLEAALAEFGVEIAPAAGAGWRLGWHDGEFIPWTAETDANQSAYLHAIGPLRLGDDPLTLLTHAGLDDDSLEIEIAGGKAWLEDLLGEAVDVFAYSTHVHDRRAVEAVRDAGYLAARDGPVSLEPWGSHLLGDPGDEAWTQGWRRTSPYELPLTIAASTIQSLEEDEIEGWLTAPDQLPLWKSQHRWIQLYTRTDSEDQTSTEIVDANRLRILLDLLLEDGDVWIAPLGEVAAWALANGQAPDPGEPLLWEAAPPGAQPWNGHACAFSFSTDDGFRTNLTHYLPEFSDLGLSYTAFCSPEKIQIGDTGYVPLLDSDGVLELAAAGVEIGCNGMTRRYLLPPEALEISAPGHGDLQLEIAAEGGRKILRLWRDW